ncbi:MAG: hypothetical protein IKF78_15855 [Atopobiaceae bacterium]|nr:hypothetical protein [Atopobiaceae bacterium]
MDRVIYELNTSDGGTERAMKKATDKPTVSGISRRSFLRLSIASIALLPTVASVSALPAEVA